MPRKARTQPGQDYGKLTVIRKADIGGSYWVCQCDCGEMRTVRSDKLRSGKVKTCGCPKPYDTKAIRWTVYLRTGSMGGATMLSEDPWISLLVNCRFSKNIEGFYISYNIPKDCFSDSIQYENLKAAVEEDMLMDIQQSIRETAQQVTQ